MSDKRRKVMIVFAENGKDDGNGFDVFMDGDVERLFTGKLAMDQASPAEFWGAKSFQIIGQVLRETGTMVNAKPIHNTTPDKGHH